MEVLRVKGVGKRFILHAQASAEIPLLRGVSLSVRAGEGLALLGPSGVGKSSLMRIIYGNYLCREGEILVRHCGAWVDIAGSDPRTILGIRRETIGYISQFLRVIPRVPAIDVVGEPLRARCVDKARARDKAAELLTRLRIPETLWSLSPVTFSGGEQQRVNIARGFAAPYPLMLVDEPTASLDPDNRDTVIDMIREVRNQGSAVVGIFHDSNVRSAVCNRFCDLAEFKMAC